VDFDVSDSRVYIDAAEVLGVEWVQATSFPGYDGVLSKVYPVVCQGGGNLNEINEGRPGRDVRVG
jgi:hypothetical protein